MSSTRKDSRFSHKSWSSGSSLLTRTISSISLRLNSSYFLPPPCCLTSLQIASAFSCSGLVKFTFPTPSVAISTEYTLTKRCKKINVIKWLKYNPTWTISNYLGGMGNLFRQTILVSMACSTSDVIAFGHNCHHLHLTSVGEKDLSNDTQKSDYLNGAWNMHENAQKFKWKKSQSKIFSHYTWLVHGKKCPSRWCFLGRF